MLAYEYAELKNFLLVFTTNINNVQATPTGNLLIDELSRMEVRAPSQARKSLKMMVNDCLEATGDWSPDQVDAFDHLLAAAGFITLTEVRHRHSRQYAKVLKRGNIKNEVEYYLLKGVLDGLTALLDDSEQVRLMTMISEYEAQVGGEEHAANAENCTRTHQ
jgi:hypothetical protein